MGSASRSHVATIAVMAKHQGKIVIQSGANVWPHEIRTAQSLTTIGKDVEFIRRSEDEHVTSADCIMDGLVWEMKAPKSNSLRRVERTLRDALKQSRNVIFDSRRMKGVPDHAIERELRKWTGELKSLDRLMFVRRNGVVIDIK